MDARVLQPKYFDQSAAGGWQEAQQTFGNDDAFGTMVHFVRYSILPNPPGEDNSPSPSRFHVMSLIDRSRRIKSE